MDTIQHPISHLITASKQDFLVVLAAVGLHKPHIQFEILHLNSFY